MNDQIKTTDELYIAAKAILEGKWIISVANFKNSLSDISTLQNSLALAAKEYEKLGDRGGHGSGHYQVAVKMESLRKKLKDRYNALIEIQAGLMASGEMTKSLQKVFIDELEDHIKQVVLDRVKNK